MKNSYIDLVKHMQAKKLNNENNMSEMKSTHNFSHSLDTIEFFKQRKHNIYNTKQVKPVAKKVVLPEKEEDIYLSTSGIKLDKTYVNPKLMNYFTNLHNETKNQVTLPDYQKDIVIEM